MKFILLIFLTLPAWAGYFTDHVKESIAINRERKLIYRKLTDGKSDKAFNKLIHIEKLMIPFAAYYDRRASWFQKRGVEIYKDDFVSMVVPEIVPGSPLAEDIVPLPWKDYRRDLKALIAKRDLEGVKNKTLSIVEEMKSQKSYHCLNRHLVESIYRIAWFMPARVKEAQEKKIKSPENLLWDTMKFHLIGFSRFAEIDLAAAPVQKEGIPLICSELPDLLSDLQK